MIYLLEVSACLIVLYAFYYSCLQYKKFHKWNRIYLLSSLGLSFIIPALSIPFYEVKVAPVNLSYTPTHNEPIFTSAIPIEQGIDLMTILSASYLFIAFFFLIKLAVELTKIIKIINSSPSLKKQFYTEVYVRDKLPLSSFFNYLLIPDPKQLTAFEVQHELAHIKQYHSIDKLLISFCHVVLWFNPVMYFMGKSFNELHEYLADEEVINQNNKTVYLNFLCNAVTKQYGFSTLNPFYSLLKNRLTMINNESKSSRKIILLIIPLCVVLLAFFSCEEYVSIEAFDTTETIEKETFVNEFAFQINSIPALEKIIKFTDHSEVNKNCKCLGFNLLYAQKGKDIIRVVNPGSTFNKDSQILIDNAKVGDKFLLDNIKLDCQDSELHTNQIIFSIEDIASNNLTHVTFNDTITYFDEQTYEETVQVVENTMSKKDYEALMLKANKVIDQSADENLETEHSNSITKQIDINGQPREYTIVDHDSQNEKKYLLSSDTITYFDEDTYEETTRVIDQYVTKEIYLAYQEALEKDRKILLTDELTKEEFGPYLLYEAVETFLTQQFFLEENTNYNYKILEKGKVVEGSKSFTLEDLKKN